MANLIDEYFKPLIFYKRGNVYTETILNQPLWFHRQQDLDVKCIEHKIKDLNNTEYDIGFLAKYITLSLENIEMNYSKIGEIDKNRLKKIAQSDERSSYAISILITFLIRDQNATFRNIALDLLKNGKSILDSVELVLFEEKKNIPLVELVFINLTYSKFSELKEFINLNLSGQNLNGFIANQTSIEKVKFNHCSLEYSDFYQSNLKNCFFNNCNLFKSNLSYLNANNCYFNDCFLEGASFEKAKLNSCYLENSNLDEIILRNCTFDNVSFENVYNLFEEQFLNKSISFLNECSIDESLYISYSDYFGELKTNKKIRLTNKKVEIQDWSKIISNQIASEIDKPSIWPKKGWKHDSYWNKEPLDQINELDEASDIYKLISYYVHSTSDNYSYNAMKLEPARLLRAYKDGNIKKFIYNEIFCSGPPSIEGRSESISIKKIICIKNNSVWRKYQQKKQNLIDSIKEKNPMNFSKIQWKTLKPILDKKVGECWLFHGTNYAHLITQNGFTSNFKEKDKLFGYGALGKGIYLTDFFSKSSVYVNCPKCNQNHCECTNKNNDYKKCKTIFLSRVLLGNAHIEKNNSLIDMIKSKDQKRYRVEPPEDFNSIWAPDKKLAISDFDSNEFCVPDEQVYPEFCIFYEENKFDKNSLDSNFFLSIRIWNSKFKQHLAKFDFCSNLEKCVKDYEGLVLIQSLKKLEFLENIFKPLVLNIFEKITFENQQIRMLIKEIQNHIESECNKLAVITLQQEYTLQLEIEINTYYNSKKWFKCISSIKKLSLCKEKYLLIRAKCYFELEQYENYIEDILLYEQAQKLQDQDLETFIKTTLTSFLNNFDEYSKKSYFKGLIQRIFEWLKKFDIETKTEIFRLISISDKEKIINKINIKDYEEIQKNELDIESRVVLNEQKFNQKIRSLFSNEKSDLEISWLNEQSHIEKGFMLKEYSDQLFDSQTGYPKIDQHEKKGKNLVILLKKNNKRVFYFKFYPDYPLRHQAVDELCKKLSGYTSYNTLIKLNHCLKPNFFHPVLVSEPLGDESKTTLDDWEKDIEKLEDNLDLYSFSWKFIETFLIQPRDEKGDNLSVNKIRNNKYFMISFDNDLTFGYKFNSTNSKEPNVYSLVYLSRLMKIKIHPAVVKNFLSLDLDDLLKNWANKLIKKNFIQTLFNEKEIQYIEKLIDQEWNYFSTTCHLDKLFTESDLININNRMHLLRDILNINTTLKLEINSNQLKVSCIADKISHFDLLKSLDKNDYEIYNDAFDKSDHYLERFSNLSGLKKNFYISKENNQLTSINTLPAGIARTLLNTFAPIISIKSIKNLNEQIKKLELHCIVRNTLKNRRPNEFFDSIYFSSINEEKRNEIIKHVSENFVYLKQINLENVQNLSDSKLFEIFKKQITLEKITIKNCQRLTNKIFSNLNKCKFYNLKNVYLSNLNFDTINTFVNIRILYLSNLKKLEALTISEGSNLKELFICSCDNLKYICVCIRNLELIEIVQNNLKNIQLDFFTGRGEKETNNLKDIIENNIKSSKIGILYFWNEKEYCGEYEIKYEVSQVQKIKIKISDITIDDIPFYQEGVCIIF